MAEYALTKLSSKGQIVIPSKMRKDFVKGEELLIIKKDNSVIIKRMHDLDKKFREDMEFAARTDKALKKYQKGEFKEKSAKDFLKDLESW
jgi:AbrB family looped-hinge helix DNA binding protein